MKNSITKENLIQFIDENFEELQAGGCADWKNLHGMSQADYTACESLLSKLLSHKHKNIRGAN